MMTGAQLESLIAAEDARAWHELCKDDPNTQNAVACVRLAVRALEECESYLKSAAESVEHTPEADRIISLTMSAENLEIDVRMQLERMK